MPPLRRLLMCFVLFALGACSKGDATDVEKTKKRAAAGDVKVQTSLGMMYSTGWGVPQDYAEAMRLYRKAADQGNAKAQGTLGLMYFNGDGVTKDWVEACAWFSIAAVSMKEAQEMRDRLSLTPEEKAQAQQRSTELFIEIEARKKAAGK